MGGLFSFCFVIYIGKAFIKYVTDKKSLENNFMKLLGKKRKVGCLMTFLK